MKGTFGIGHTGSALLLTLVFAAVSSCSTTEAVERMPPVVYVPGIWDTPSTFDRMAEALGKAGWQTYEVPLKPDDGSVSLTVLAEQMRRFIDGNLGKKSRFNIVAFSMGGLVARSYVQRLGGLGRVIHFVTISTPHHGTNTAQLGKLTGFLEMRPDSAFLRDLNKDANRMSRVLFTSIWSPLDLMIEPAASSRLPSGRNVEIPVALHNWMLTDGRVIDAVLGALAAKK